MKHLPYENWILDEPKLSLDEAESLAQHLTSCKQCSRIKSGWEVSKILLTEVNFIVPEPGFTARWQNTLIKKCSIEKVRSYRITTLGLMLFTFSASVIYMAASGSFLQLLANFFNSIIQTMIAITNGLSTIGFWANNLPTMIPLAAGFIFFGMINAFLISAVFTIWNLKKVKAEVNENSLD